MQQLQLSKLVSEHELTEQPQPGPAESPEKEPLTKGGICILLCIHDTFHGLEPLSIVGWRAGAQFVNWKRLAHQRTFEMGDLWLR